MYGLGEPVVEDVNGGLSLSVAYKGMGKTEKSFLKIHLSLHENSGWSRVQLADNFSFWSCQTIFVTSLGALGLLYAIYFLITTGITAILLDGIYNLPGGIEELDFWLIPGMALVLSLVVALYLFLLTWLHKRFIRKFWKSLGWQQGFSKLLQGELISEKSQDISETSSFLMIVLGIILMAIMGFPVLFLATFALVAGLPNLASLWRPIPLFYWKARMLEEAALKISEVAFRILSTHYMLMFAAIGLARAFEFLSLSMFNADLSLIAIYIDSLSNFSMELNSLGDILPFIAGDPAFFGFQTGLAPTDFGAVIVRLMTTMPTNPDYPLSPQGLAAILLAWLLIIIGSTWLGNFRSYLQTPKRWKERYHSLFKATPLLQGVNTTEIKWWQQALFTSWVIFRWIIAIFVVLYALWIVGTVSAWLLGDMSLPGLSGLVYPYALMDGLATFIAEPYENALRWLIVILLLAPITLIIFLQITSWLILQVRNILRLLIWRPTKTDRELWLNFLEKYSVGKYRMAIVPHGYDLQAFHAFGWAGIAIPKAIWQDYLDGKSLSREQGEFIFLHEIGHLRARRWVPLLKLLGAISFVGQGYFGLIDNSLDAEQQADDFARDQFHIVHGEEFKDNDLEETLHNYSLLAHSPRLKKNAWALIPSRIASAFSTFTFYWGHEELGYAHPEIHLRKSKREKKEKDQHAFWQAAVILLSLFLPLFFLSRFAIRHAPAIAPAEANAVQEIGADFFWEISPLHEAPQRVYDIAEYQDQVILTSQDGLFLLENDRLAGVNFHVGETESTPDTFSLLETDGKLWIGSVDLLLDWDAEGLHPHRLLPGSIIQATNQRIYISRILQDNQETLYLQTTEGVASFAQDGKITWHILGTENERYHPLTYGTAFQPPAWVDQAGYFHYTFYEEEQILRDGRLYGVMGLDSLKQRLSSDDQNRLFWLPNGEWPEGTLIPIARSRYGISDDPDAPATFPPTLGIWEGQTLVDNRGHLWLFFDRVTPAPVLCSENCAQIIPLPLGTEWVYDLYIRSTGEIALLYQTGENMECRIFDRQGNTLDEMAFTAELEREDVISVYMDKERTVWLGTMQDGLWYAETGGEFQPFQ